MRALKIAATMAVFGATFGACADANEAPQPHLEGEAGPSPVEAGAGSDASAGASDEGGASRVCTDDSWCHTELPAGHSLLDLWSDAQGTAWAVSDEGGILRWDGGRWSVHFRSSAKLAAIWGSGPADLWAGGTDGLFHGDGLSWTKVPLEEEGIEIEDIGGKSASDVWAVGRSAAGQPRVFHLVERGAGFSREPIEDVLDEHEYNEYFTDARRVVVTSNGDVWVFISIIAWDFVSDYLYRRPGVPSASWSQAPFPNEFAQFDYSDLKFSGAGSIGDDVWLFGNVDSIGASYWVGSTSAVDERTDWKMGRWKHTLDREFDGVARSGVWGLGANDVWIVGAMGRIQHWNGSVWTTQRVLVDGVPIGDGLHAIGGRSNDDLWAVGGPRALHKVSTEEANRLNAEHAKKDGTR